MIAPVPWRAYAGTARTFPALTLYQADGATPLDLTGGTVTISFKEDTMLADAFAPFVCTVANGRLAMGTLAAGAVTASLLASDTQRYQQATVLQWAARVAYGGGSTQIGAFGVLVIAPSAALGV